MCFYLCSCHQLGDYWTSGLLKVIEKQSQRASSIAKVQQPLEQEEAVRTAM